MCTAWCKGEAGQHVLTKANFDKYATNAKLCCNGERGGKADKASQHTRLRDQEGRLGTLPAGLNWPKSQRENRWLGEMEALGA